MPIHLVGVLLHTITGSELSRVRTELKGRRVLAAIPPQPVQASPHPSTMITYSNSPCRERDAHSLGRCSTAHHYRFRAFPRANRTQATPSTRGHSATTSTSEPPSFVPSLPWQCSVAGAWPGVDSGVASPRYNVRRPVLPPPTRNAITNCLAY